VAGSIRQDVIQFITDRPNEVITRNDIVKGCDGRWNERQVRDAVRRVQTESPIGQEIQTLVQGSTWRFVPRITGVPSTPIPVPTPVVRPATNQDLPLTTLIREYLVDHAHALVSLEDLVAYTGRAPHQVQVGVNNMRRIASNGDVTTYLEIEAHGRLWRFNPPADWRPGRQPNRRSSTPVPSSPSSAASVRPTVATASVVEPTASPTERAVDVTSLSGNGTRLFEEVGELRDGRVVISDQDGNMYTATPIKTATD
jgi:hypothetical protein